MNGLCIFVAVFAAIAAMGVAVLYWESIRADRLAQHYEPSDPDMEYLGEFEVDERGVRRKA